MTTVPYHPGELLVQARAGVTAEAARVGEIVRSAIPPAAAAFLAEREMVVVASVAPDGRVWASLLTGEPGFARALDDRTVRVDAAPAGADPLADALRPDGPPAPVGLLAIDLATRRRMRLNGVARLTGGGRIELEARQVYSNCPKYIQARSVELRPRGPSPAAARGSDSLSPSQRNWVEAADTFFIASAHPDAGADASHRGGDPGFVLAPDAGTVCFPDYAGNNMFNTLGNIAANPAVGLLFPDFERGRTLQLTGAAVVAWDGVGDAAPPADPASTRRTVTVRVSRAIETDAAIPHRYHLLGRSPFNPAVQSRGCPDRSG